MLIFDSKYSGYGKDKPKQWGSISSVRSAVFRNASAMGIDPHNIITCMPFFEGAGSAAHDLGRIGVQQHSFNSFTSNNRYVMDKGHFDTGHSLGTLSSLSVISSLTRTDYESSDTGLFSNITDANWSTGNGVACVIRRSSSSGGFLFYVGGEETYNSSNDFMAVGEKHTVGFVFEPTIKQSIFFDGVEISYDNHAIATALPSSPYDLTIGTYYTGYLERRLRAEIDYLYAFESALTDTQIAQLHETPYALLQPNPTPIFFDMGDGSGAIELVLADALHSHSADSLALSQNHNITTADSAHAQTADSLALLQQHILSLSDATHSHTADSLTIIQQQLLSILDSAHAQTADSLTLQQIHNLTVADSHHDHSADNITLLLGALILAIADATHSHTADGLTLQQQHQLVIAEALHAHTADNLTIDLSLVLAIADAIHAHGADGLTLTQNHILNADDALHQLLSDNPTLLQQHNITVADATHAQTADELILYLHGLGLGIISDTTAINLTPKRGALTLTVERSAKHV